MAGSGPGSAIHPLTFGPVWARTLAVLRGNGAVLWPLAAAFFFLPQLLISYVAPAHAPAKTQDLAQSFPVLFVGAVALLATLVGQVSVAFIAVKDGTGGLILKQVIARSARLLLPALALVTIQGIAVVLGGLLFIIPGLWLMARLAVAMPIFATGTDDPVEALTNSWRMSEGRALRIFGCLAILLLGVLALYLGMVSVGAATGVIGGKAAVPGASGGWGLGRWVFEVGSNAIVGAIALVSTCFHASLLVAVRQCRRLGL